MTSCGSSGLVTEFRRSCRRTSFSSRGCRRRHGGSGTPTLQLDQVVVTGAGCAGGYASRRAGAARRNASAESLRNGASGSSEAVRDGEGRRGPTCRDHPVGGRLRQRRFRRCDGASSRNADVQPHEHDMDGFALHATMRTVRVKPYSAAYFALLERLDDLRAPFASWARTEHRASSSLDARSRSRLPPTAPRRSMRETLRRSRRAGERGARWPGSAPERRDR